MKPPIKAEVAEVKAALIKAEPPAAEMKEVETSLVDYNR